jgi:GH25 family lysozyme M1 (1,4-beta-N-acetylmuramidase)
MALYLIACAAASAMRPGAIFGPDISHYQGTVDWRAINASGASFAFVKASEGLHSADDQFAKNWAASRASGVPVRGAYHFGHPDEAAVQQASHFLSVVGNLSSGEFLVLDLETDGGRSASEVGQWCDEFLSAVTRGSGLPPSRVLIYTGAWFWDPHVGQTWSPHVHPLWVSGYARAPPMPKDWRYWTFWQYTDSATDCGPHQAVDCSVFNGTLAEMHALAGL